MKKQVFALLGLVCSLCIAQHASLVSAASRECREVSYQQILNEMDHYIYELDRYDREETWLRFQSTHNAMPPNPQRLADLHRQREQCARNLIRIQEQLDRAHVDIGRSLMGSSTGFCEENGNLYRLYQDTSSDREEGVYYPSSSRTFIDDDDLKKSKKNTFHDEKKGKPDDNDSDYSDVEGDLNGGAYWRHQQSRLRYTRKLLHQKDQLTMQQVRMAAKLGSVTVPALNRSAIIAPGGTLGRRRFEGRIRSHQNSSGGVRRWVDNRGVLHNRRSDVVH